MRAIFNGRVGRFLIITVCIGVHLLFAIGMFYLGRLLVQVQAACCVKGERSDTMEA